ncbi:MAG: hypothetical protein GY757_34815, partial [bacterium]|nr:hypothetical protein [bacterium]
MNSTTSSTHQAVAAAQYSNEEKYWLEKFSGELEKSTFYYDYQKPAAKEAVMKTARFEITGEKFEKLIKIINQSDFRLHIILVAAVTLLINKYTATADIIVGTPVLKQEQEAEFINTILP